MGAMIRRAFTLAALTLAVVACGSSVSKLLREALEPDVGAARRQRDSAPAWKLTSRGIRYIETPATVWGAESVLIDEISRCKPEHQNRLFSLVHERKIQGIPITKLRYRWLPFGIGIFN